MHAQRQQTRAHSACASLGALRRACISGGPSGCGERAGAAPPCLLSAGAGAAPACAGGGVRGRPSSAFWPSFRSLSLASAEARQQFSIGLGLAPDEALGGGRRAGRRGSECARLSSHPGVLGQPACVSQLGLLRQASKQAVTPYPQSKGRRGEQLPRTTCAGPSCRSAGTAARRCARRSRPPTSSRRHLRSGTALRAALAQ